MPVEPARTATTIVICCYTTQRWPDLVQAVSEVERQGRGAVEILVCVDHNDSLLARARQELPQARVVENTQQRGLSGARNTAVDHASGEVLVFLDDDAVPGQGWLSALLNPFRDDTVIAVGGAARPEWPQRRPSWFPGEFDWVVGCSYVGLPTRRAAVRNVMGCNMAFRREVFDAGLRFSLALGRTGENTAGCEETKLCIQVHQLWPERVILFEPEAVVHHRVPPSRCSWSYFARRCYSEGRSKARVSGLVGSNDALRTEWAYTRQTIPQGVGRGLLDALAGEANGLVRSAAIMAGLGITSAGYAWGRYGR